jgi:flagellin
VGANFETGDFANELSFSLGDASTAGHSIGNLSAAQSLTTQSTSNAAISVLDTAIEDISSRRGAIGAMQIRLASMINSLGVAAENTGAANSRIRDADIAQAVSEMTRAQILQQFTMAVLAQANHAPQMALQLLKSRASAGCPPGCPILRGHASRPVAGLPVAGRDWFGAPRH